MISLALRYMLAKKKQTLLILLGIFFGTCAFVMLSGLLLGWTECFEQEFVHNNAHIYIKGKNHLIEEHDLDRFFYSDNRPISWITPPSHEKNKASIENPKKWYTILKNDPRIYAFSPRFSTQASFKYGGKEFSFRLIGCYPDQENYIKNLKENILNGKFEDIAIGSNRLAIGEDMSKALGVKLYDNVMISVSQSTPIPFKVVAILKKPKNMWNFEAYGYFL